MQTKFAGLHLFAGKSYNLYAPNAFPWGKGPAGADEGRGAVTVLLKLQSDLQVLPGPHPSAALRSAATVPQGKAWELCTPRLPL